MRNSKAYLLISSLIVIVASGTVFFHFVEGWSWVDAYFFSVVTLSTVGYGSLVPVTAIGKIGTTVFIFVGLGVFAVAIQYFGTFAVRKREQQSEWFEAHLGQREHPDPAPANEDEDPRN